MSSERESDNWNIELLVISILFMKRKYYYSLLMQPETHTYLLSVRDSVLQPVSSVTLMQMQYFCPGWAPVDMVTP